MNLRTNSKRHHPLIAVSLASIALLALVALAGFPALSQAQDGGDAQATVDAAVQAAFTQTAEAQTGAAAPDATAAFQQTVEAALANAQTATAQAQQAADEINVQPAEPDLEIITATNAPNLNSIALMGGSAGAFNTVTVSLNGQIAAGHTDGIVTVMDLEAQGEPLRLEHEAEVLGVGFHPTEPILYTTDAISTLYQWNSLTGELLASANNSETSAGALVVGVSETLVATFDLNGTFTLWNPNNLEVISNSTGADFVLPFLEVGPPLLARTPSDNPATIEVIPLDGGTPILGISFNDATYAEAVDFSADGTRLMVTVDDGQNRVYNLLTGEEEFSFPARGFGLAKFSPAGNLIIEGGQDGNLYILDGETGAEIAALPGHDDIINEVDFEPDGTTIATASNDGSVRIWRVGDLPTEVDTIAAAPTTAPSQTTSDATPAPEQDTASADNGTPLPEGFPAVTEAEVQVAEQVFEGGRMFWVQPVNQIWVMVVDEEGQGQWLVYEDNFDENEDLESDPSLTPPEGLLQPTRGFGKLWRENPEVQDLLGWALTPEFGYISRYKYVPGGEIVNGEYVPGPGYHVLFSLDSEAFRFNEATSTWQLGEGES